MAAYCPHIFVSGGLVFGSALPPASSRPPATCHTQLVHAQLTPTQLVHTQLVTTQLAHTQLTHTQLVHTHNLLTQNLLSHNLQLTPASQTQLVHTTCPHTTCRHTIVAHANPSPSLFSLPHFPFHLYLSFASYWKKLTCGVIRSFNFCLSIGTGTIPFEV